MKYHNDGVLRAEQDSTLRIRPELREQKMTCVEYLPVVVLCLLMAGLLISSIFG